MSEAMTEFERNTGFKLELGDRNFAYVELSDFRNMEDHFLELFMQSPFFKSLEDHTKKLNEEIELKDEEIRKYKTFYLGFHGKL